MPGESQHNVRSNGFHREEAAPDVTLETARNPTFEKPLTVKQLAATLGVKVGWVYSRTSPRCSDPIPHMKVGKYVLFYLSKVQEWLTDHSR